MKVEGRKYVEIDIDKHTQQEVTEKFLLKVFKMERSYYLEKENVMDSWEEHGGSHGWTEIKKIRKATANDKIYFQFMKLFNEKLNKDLIDESDY